MNPIAHIRTPFGEKFGTPRQSGLVDVLCEIHFEKEYRVPEALRGLEEFDYIWLIWGFSLNRDNEFRPTVRPPRLGGNERIGVFATRSPYRPNPIGLSTVMLDHVDFEKCIVYVRGADLVDGTPIYDIKPYISYTDSHPEAVSGFTDSTEWRSLKVAGAENLPEGLVKALEQDPRPHYQNEPGREYGILYGGRNYRFRVDGDILTVVSQC